MPSQLWFGNLSPLDRGRHVSLPEGWDVAGRGTGTSSTVPLNAHTRALLKSWRKGQDLRQMFISGPECLYLWFGYQQ